MTLLGLVADGLDPDTTRPWETAGELAKVLDPATVQTPALNLVDAALGEVADGLCQRLIITMSPQEGKSERVSRRFPVLLLHRNPDLRLGIASYESLAARRWGRTTRNDIVTHSDKLGLSISQDTSAANEWTVRNHRGGVYTVGIGGALTGRPLDGLIIDDPVKDRAQAESETYRQAVWDWWTDTARTRLSPDGFVVLIQTRWHEDDLAGRLLANNTEGWRLINIPARADHNPDRGEADVLGREPGEWLRSARGRTAEQWEAIERAVGARTFSALYQGAPAPDEGDLFKRADWQRFDLRTRAALRDDGTMHCPGADEVLQSWDMAFKDTKSSDYVVGQVWARFGNQAYLLDQARARLSFSATVAAVQEMTRRWPQATRKLVEDKANGTAVIDQLKSNLSGLVPINPGTDSKYVRALAVTPLVEAHQVHVPNDQDVAWAAGFVDEHAAFPASRNDDQVDAMTQAVSRLLDPKRGVVSAASPAKLGAGLPVSPFGGVRVPGVPLARPR